MNVPQSPIIKISVKVSVYVCDYQKLKYAA